MQAKEVTIKAPNFSTALFTIEGIAPYGQHKFASKAKQAMRDKQEAGSQAKKGKKRDPKNFDENYREAQYRSADGDWNGIPAGCIRSAMISACWLVDCATAPRSP